MTSKCYLAVTGLLAILVGAGFAVGMMLPPTPGVTKVNYDKLKNRMSQEEAEASIGSRFTHIIAADGSSNYQYSDPLGDNLIAIDYLLVAEGERMVWCLSRKEWCESNRTIGGRIRRWLHLP